MTVLFSGFRDERHSKYGGYDWIRFYPRADYLSDQDVALNYLRIGQRGKFINLYLLDKKTRKMAKKYDIVHYFYGDLTLFSPFHNNKTYKVISTIHCDTNKLEKHHHNIIKCIKSLDAIIVLNSRQCEDLRSKYGINAFYIPHGFNRPIFTFVRPEIYLQDFDSDKINIVSIGRQYRDYKLLHNAIKYLEHNDKCHFYLLGLKNEEKEKFSKCINVTVCNRLDDDKYYSLIKSCDYSFLPLTFATANNTLMESQYLGVKMILPKISGVSDYACDQENLFYLNEQDVFNIFDTIIKQKKSTVLEQYAEKYSWQSVYAQLEVLYRNILG